jgi:ChrB-like protein
MATDWLLCSYRLPREPSRLRLAIWRRLKRLGAVPMHDAVWVLPADSKTREGFEWLAEQIEERGGSALLWQARSLGPAQDRHLVDRFREDADSRYAAIAEAAGQLARAARRRAKAPVAEQALQRIRLLERALRLERRRDFFRAPGRESAELAVGTALEQLQSITRSAVPRRSRAVGH